MRLPLAALFLAAIPIAATANIVSIEEEEEKNNHLRTYQKSNFLLHRLAERDFQKKYEESTGRNLKQVFRRLDRPNRKLGNYEHTCGENEVKNGHFILNDPHYWSPMNSELSMVPDDQGGHAVKASSREGWFSGISTNLIKSGCLNVNDHINIHVRWKVPYVNGNCVPIAEQKENCPLVVLGSEYVNGTHHQEKLFDPAMMWDHEQWNIYNKEYTLEESNAGPDVVNMYIVIVGGMGEMLVSDVSLTVGIANQLQQDCIDKCKRGSWLDPDTTCQEARDKYHRDYDECRAELNIFSHMDNLVQFCTEICVDHALPSATEA